MERRGVGWEAVTRKNRWRRRRGTALEVTSGRAQSLGAAKGKTRWRKSSISEVVYWG